MTIIAFGYKAGVGKDVAAKYLVDKYGFTKVAFADNLKECCMAVCGLTAPQVFDGDKKQELFNTPFVFDEKYHLGVLSWMACSLGCSVADFEKTGFSSIGAVLNTPRDILQFVGTDVMRYHSNNYHVEVCFSGMAKNKNYVISDVRFRNEAEAVVSACGYCVKINRPPREMSKTNDAHASEVDLDSWDGWYSEIDNTLEGFEVFYKNIDNLLERLNV